ncbi:hypothetical protein Pint_23011 [Pistacia integerrima]|uniref:Uncharacterized protein n=1 Tax=Pistacia integerrima TaxID=434235 RepID=A0ACC0YHF1_9ROSI|nr:hypothetical protein Pint_23011 [Pistacia integerrima]
MAARRLSLLLSRSASSNLFLRGSPGDTVTISRLTRGAFSYSTSAAIEEPLTPSVKVDYTQLLINGKFVDSASGKTFPTLDPRTGNVIAHVAEGDSEDVDRAVAAARKAFDEGPWPKMTAYVTTLHLRLKDQGYFCALLICLKNIMMKLQHLRLGIMESHMNRLPKLKYQWLCVFFRYYAGWADKIHGLTVPADGEHHVQILHEPFGVAGQIIPWNFPLLMFAWKVAPALACGNTIVLKTAEQTPLSALYAAKLFLEAGLPPGVLNIISGFGPTAGAALSSHMDVDKLAFTGSTDTGKIVLQLAAKSNLKPVTLELGGKSPFIVCEDADVEKAAELAHFALFFNQGQCCCAGSRTFVHERIYDQFLEKAKALAVNRVVGDPFKAGIQQGPQIDTEQFEKILRYIRVGVDSGATLETGGERFGSTGYYVQPTVFSNVQDDMLIAKEEIFGPVQSILKFKDLGDVVRRANTTRYGLAAGVFTQNIDTANTLTRALRAGTVWVNCFDVFDAAIPFGGYKMSGQGREKGIYGLNSYLQVKAVVTPLKNPAWI